MTVVIPGESPGSPRLALWTGLAIRERRLIQRLAYPNQASLEWVDWINNQRLLTPIGDVPPAEFEAMYYEKQESPTTAVGLN
jgi:transposase InsO family protein